MVQNVLHTGRAEHLRVAPAQTHLSQSHTRSFQPTLPPCTGVHTHTPDVAHGTHTLLTRSPLPPSEGAWIANGRDCVGRLGEAEDGALMGGLSLNSV